MLYWFILLCQHHSGQMNRISSSCAVLNIVTRNAFCLLALQGLTQHRLFKHLFPALFPWQMSVFYALQCGNHCCFGLLLYLANDALCCPFCVQGRGLSANCPEAWGPIQHFLFSSHFWISSHLPPSWWNTHQTITYLEVVAHGHLQYSRPLWI